MEQERTPEELHTARWAEFSRALDKWLVECKPTSEQAFKVIREAGRLYNDPMKALEGLNNNND